MSSDGALRRVGRASGFGAMGGFGGTLLLVNALSSKIYELIVESTQTIVRGYEHGGLLGLVRSPELRALLRRYLWLVGVAFAFERVRTLWSYVNGFSSVTQYFRVDAHVKSGDQAYEWLLAYWEHSRAFSDRSRNFAIETGQRSAAKRRGHHAIHVGDIDYTDAPGQGGKALQIRVSPNDTAVQWIWHRGTLFKLRRWQHATASNWDSETVRMPMISIRSYSFSRKPLFSLLRQAKKIYTRTQPQMISIRVLDQRATWRKVAYKARRPLSSIIMDADKREALLKDAKEFLKSEDWYAARGLRWNRGYLLHGSPGTGKSSTILALASEIKLDVYIVSLNSPMMSDTLLGSAMRSIPPKSIVCMEDVDAIFSNQARELPDVNRHQPLARLGMPMGLGMARSIGSGNQLSLSAVLNILDGCESNEGRLLVMSTNVLLDDLDAALNCPGRCDMFIHYKKATRAQAEELFNTFYTPAKQGESSGSELPANETLSSGAQSPVEKDIHSLETPPPTPLALPTATEKKKAAHYHPFTLSPEITTADIQRWAGEWASHVTDEQFTIAELQGMLLAYKKDPEGAMKDMPEWIVKEEKTRAEQTAQREKFKQEQARREAENASTAQAEEEKVDRKAGLFGAKLAKKAKAEKASSNHERATQTPEPARQGSNATETQKDTDGATLEKI